MTAVSSPTPTLSQLLAALDRLPAEEATQALARDMAQVCVEEGRPVTAQALVTAAHAQLLADQQATPSDTRDLLSPRWSRPTSVKAWEHAQHVALEALNTQREHLRTHNRHALGLLALGVLGAIGGLAGMLAHSLWGMGVGMGMELVAVGVMVPKRDRAEVLCQKLKEARATLDALSVFAGPLRDEAMDSALARAYAAQHTATGVPLLNGDEKTLLVLGDLESSYQRVATWLPPAQAEPLA